MRSVRLLVGLARILSSRSEPNDAHRGLAELFHVTAGCLVKILPRQIAPHASRIMEMISTDIDLMAIRSMIGRGAAEADADGVGSSRRINVPGDGLLDAECDELIAFARDAAKATTIAGA